MRYQTLPKAFSVKSQYNKTEVPLHLKQDALAGTKHCLVPVPVHQDVPVLVRATKADIR